VSALDAGRTVIATVRDRPERLADLAACGVLVRAGVDAGDPGAIAALLAEHPVEAAILAPILTVSARAAPALAAAGVSRAVFFSSNNVAIDPEAPIYAALAAAEAQVRGVLPSAAVLRPTMIYGHPGDGNLARLIGVMRRWRIAPIPGSGAALQQPIHADDVGRAAVAALGEQACAGATFALGGSVVLTLHDLYRACAQAIGQSVLTPRVPVAPLVPLARLAGLGAAQFARIERDKTAHGPVPPPALAPRLPLQEGLARLARQLARP
jgi:nucleoside-diphosphate-sugar epimerase